MEAHFQQRQNSKNWRNRMDDGVLREITVLTNSEGIEWLVAVLKKRLPNHDLKNYIDGLDEDDAFDSFYKRA
jgi:hypothetical protein